ncbi:MAG: LuxR C-terminal-related transcriptional regulator [Ornithinimicrobium sp.]|uniref:helix-turn-helix transcriptional regulator n=1 Tax=Ornithinimicrobium sp. TaxID=1977084 RepID=UPI0026DEAE4C|nr:LuxR C-terminal-related transcriptional regulator [Ornithinimicrobium sp.]MDO5739684.1 LuxR C-terminal-related transcriptional regulator [Ornithinimicrobium sp.]
MAPRKSTIPDKHLSHGEAFEQFIGRVYLTAVRLGTPGRAGLRGTGLSDAEIDHAMTELIARELILPSTERDVWSVAPPREAISRYASQVERRLALSLSTASEVEAIWRRAVGTGQPNPHPNFDLLGSAEDIADRLIGLHRVATTRFWWALENSAATRLLLERSAEDDSVLSLRKGMDIRIVFDTSLLDNALAMALLEGGHAQGHAIRVGNGVPLSLALCDDRSAMVDLSSFDPTGEGSIEVRGRAPLLAVEKLLDEIWQLATPFGPTVEAASRSSGDRAPLDPRDQRILSLLSSGMSDQVIARQAGVSVRTVERRVRYILDHLGAATRFQAGVQAVRRGWVE